MATGAVVWWGWEEGLQISLWILQSWGPGTFGQRETQRSAGLEGTCQIQPTTHLSDGETEARERKGLGQSSSVSSFQLPPQHPLPELVGLPSARRCAWNTEYYRTWTNAEEPGSPGILFQGGRAVWREVPCSAQCAQGFPRNATSNIPSS